MKRTSLRVRNPQNAPDEMERQALAWYDGLRAAGQPLPTAPTARRSATAPCISSRGVTSYPDRRGRSTSSSERNSAEIHPAESPGRAARYAPPSAVTAVMETTAAPFTRIRLLLLSRSTGTTKK